MAKKNENDLAKTSNPSYTEIAEGAFKGAQDQGEKIATRYAEVANTLDSLRASLLPTGDMQIDHTSQLINNQQEQVKEGLGQLQDAALNSPKILPVIGNSVMSAPETAEKKYQEIKTADSVKRAELIAGAAVAMTEFVVDPLKKIKPLEEINDASKTLNATGKAHSIDGEYLKAGDEKGLTNKASSALAHVNVSEALKSELQSIFEHNKLSRVDAMAEKVKNPLQAVLNDPKNVILQTAYESKPSAMNRIDARYHGNRGDEGALLDEHSLQLARAQQWSSALTENSDLAKSFSGMDKKGANALLNDSRFDKTLGIVQGERQLPAPMTPVEEKLAESIKNLNSTKQSQEALKNAIDRQANRPDLGKSQGVIDTVTQVLTPGAANTTGVLDRKLIEAQGSDSAVLKQMANLVGQKYIAGKAVVGFAVYKALDYANGDNENESNSKLFKEKIRTKEGQDYLLTQDKDFKNPIDWYNNLHTEHFSPSAKPHEKLDPQAEKANNMVIEKMGQQIADKGLISFSNMSKTQEQQY